jgi:putative ABC transport system substrate-binding protein
MASVHKKIVLVVAVILAVAAFFFLSKRSDLPIIAIANYGQHASLNASINGIKAQLADAGFVDGRTIKYEIRDVGFDHSIIPQMIVNLSNLKPRVLIVLSTPVAQFAKGKIYDIPIVYNVITDPVGAKLITHKDQSENNVTGSSDMQDLGALLNFVKSILPTAKTVGLLYAISDNNDTSLMLMMRSAAAAVGMTIFAVPVDQARDIPVRMQEFKGKVDFIYVGTSGPIQPALPIVSSEAAKMGIPVFNVEEQAVRDGLALASCGVDYESVGRNAGKLVVQLLKGADIKTLKPLYPILQDHKCVINKKQAEKFAIKIPSDVTIVE